MKISDDHKENSAYVISGELRAALWQWYVEVGSPKMGKFESEKLYREAQKYFDND